MSDHNDFDYSGAKSAPLRTDKRFQTTKTGLIGAQRDTMLQNELQFLVYIYISQDPANTRQCLIKSFFTKPQLGKSRTRGHQLPPNDFIYGVKYEKIDGGVPEGSLKLIN